ncbi:MAG: 4Fe-4S binding protein [Spirochaetes bacterium]|nr:4Fe-4S binding protein [Spirochaetota bacterium]MBU1079374.1 4Fe-4S binding protein [Spirochaetota bacterium]
MNGPSFHSVTLDPAKCKGCTTCIRFCPTEAIRVRKGRAYIIDERCIDCGECIRTCPNNAKKAVSDPLSAIERFAVRVALPAPTLYGQFDERFSVDRILCGLLDLGFTDVFEVAEAAEAVASETAGWIAAAGDGGPWISSACPAVVKLLQVRFPSLLDRLAPVISPMEAAARIVKERLYPGRADVGVFFISPCAGKVTVSRVPQGLSESAVDGVISIKDIYLPLRNALPGVEERPIARASGRGVAWAHIDGESDAVGVPRAISVSGIADVIGVFEALENGKLKDVAFIEALACPAGCVGGPLTVENPYIARARLKALERRSGEGTDRRNPVGEIQGGAPGIGLGFEEPVKARSGLRLAPDMLKAMILLEETELIGETLPGLDCGSCGAPTCRAFAEDVAKGDALITDCIFKLRENVRKLAEELINMERLQPPGLDKD